MQFIIDLEKCPDIDLIGEILRDKTFKDNKKLLGCAYSTVLNEIFVPCSPDNKVRELMMASTSIGKDWKLKKLEHCYTCGGWTVAWHLQSDGNIAIAFKTEDGYFFNKDVFSKTGWRKIAYEEPEVSNGLTPKPIKESK